MSLQSDGLESGEPSVVNSPWPGEAERPLEVDSCPSESDSENDTEETICFGLVACHILPKPPLSLQALASYATSQPSSIDRAAAMWLTRFGMRWITATLYP